MIKDTNTRVTITITKEIEEKAKIKAKEQDRTLSSYITQLIKKDTQNF